MIETLPRIIEAAPDKPELAGPDHPIRQVTRQIAFAPDAWTRERAAKVMELFDGLAPEWHTRQTAGRLDSLRDALARGQVPEAGFCVEIGSGTGAGTRYLTERFESVVALDLSMEMLKRAPVDRGQRVQADAADMPIPSGTAQVIVLVNAFLFPSEIARVLAPEGVVVWVSSLGDRTPIYLSAQDVATALPGEWTGCAAVAGWGSWCVLGRRLEMQVGGNGR